MRVSIIFTLNNSIKFLHLRKHVTYTLNDLLSNLLIVLSNDAVSC
jgi:hypothetical protein